MPTTTVLSRRALFSTSAAALAASAVTVTPAALASIPAMMPAVPEVDARLWELARALGPTEQEWFETCEAHSKAEFAYFKQVPKRPEPFDGSAAREWKTAAEEVAERVGYYDTKQVQDEARERLDAIHDELWDLTAETLIGLQAKAEAVRTLAYEQDFEEYVEEFYSNNGKSPESIALVVVRDILRMAVTPKS